MTIETETVEPRRGSWVVVIALGTVHLAAFGMLYLVLVQITSAFDDHYSAVGYALTDRFSSVLRLSNFVAAFTWLVLLVIAIDLGLVCRLARSGNRWASAYSHAALMTIGFVGFLSIAWLIHPMIWSRPGAGNPPPAIANVTNGDPGVAVAVSASRE